MRKAALKELRAFGVVAMQVHLRPGAGAHICGEKTALLESLEGRRGYPWHKLPFPGQHGLFGQPTVIHNVATLWGLPGILATAERADPGLPDSLVFIPFAYREAAAKLLTDPRLDPDGKIPSFKY